MLHAHQVGKSGEDAAVAWLAKQGYAVVARNVRVRGGELDAVLRRGAEWLFIEVKTRHAHNVSSAPQDIHPSQVRRLARMVESIVVRRSIERWQLWLVCVTVEANRCEIFSVNLTESLDFG